MVPENIHTSDTEGIGNSGGVGGWMVNLVSRRPSPQYGFKYRSNCSEVLSYLLNRSFTWKNRSLSEYLYLNRIIFEINFLSKNNLEAEKCKERAVTWKWLPLLVTNHMK